VYAVDKALDVAERAMARRGVTLGDGAGEQLRGAARLAEAWRAAGRYALNRGS
jgi:hypothetical protein